MSPAISTNIATTPASQSEKRARIAESTHCRGIAKDVCGLIGRTPMVVLNKVTSGCEAEVVAKVEGMEVGSSVKDRIGRAMLLDAEKRGLITPGVTTIIEPTGGNTGIALAMVAPQMGYKCILVMPDTMSLERRMVLRALGSEVVLTPWSKGIQAMFDKAADLRASIPNSHTLQQWENPANPQIHYETTGPEIWDGCSGHVDMLVAGVGTGGTLCGSARYLKEKNPGMQVVAVEPAESPVLSGGKPGVHNIQGIGAGFVPQNYDPSLVDEVLPVSTQDAMTMARRIALEEGIMVGISSGAAAAAAAVLGKRPENRGKRIVAILPSCGERYLTTDLFKDVREEAQAMTPQ